MGRPSGIPAAAPITVTVDGTDLHDYGMTVTTRTMPIPAPRDASVSLAGRDGDYDYTRNYGNRSITLQGTISGVTHTDLMSNIDALNSFFRVRQNGKTLKVIFQDQTDRYWTCRYEGGFSPNFASVWMYGKAVNYSLTLRCVKPYAESTTLTSETIFWHCLRNKKITYAGTLPTPLQIQMVPRYQPNILERDVGKSSEDHTLWLGTNCSLSTIATPKVYGSASVKFTRTAGGAYSGYINMTMGSGIIDVTKNYVIGAFAWTAAGVNTLSVSNQTGVIASSAFGSTASAGWEMTFVKVTAAMLAGSTSFRLTIGNDGSDATFAVDGIFIYEITAAEAADATYFPPPYMTDAYGGGHDDWLPPKNPAPVLCRGINIAPTPNGSASGWLYAPASLSVVSDPFGGSDQCLLFSTQSATEVHVESPHYYLTGGKTYKVSFDYYVEMVSSGGKAYLGMNGLLENQITARHQTYLEVTSPGTAWATYQGRHTTGLCEAVGAVFLGGLAGSALKVYVKNIMVVEANAIGDAYDTYVAPDRRVAAYTGSLDQNDALMLDNDKMTASAHDYSTNTTSNAMAGLVTDRLMLEPGSNYLRYLDARNGAAEASEESCGAVDAKISYRARYL